MFKLNREPDPMTNNYEEVLRTASECASKCNEDDDNNTDVDDGGGKSADFVDQEHTVGQTEVTYS